MSKTKKALISIGVFFIGLVITVLGISVGYLFSHPRETACGVGIAMMIFGWVGFFSLGDE